MVESTNAMPVHLPNAWRFRKNIRGEEHTALKFYEAVVGDGIPPMYIESKTNSCYSQEITHTVNTPFLLIEIRMNIQIKCRCHI